MKNEQNRVIYGYTRNALGKMEVQQNRASIIELIYHTYLDNKSLAEIAKILENSGIPSPSGKIKWGAQALDNLLSNEKYFGNKIYPKIISRTLFDKVQENRKARTASKEIGGVTTSSSFNTSNLFTGMVFCKECGKAYRRITRGNGKVVWRCANRVEHGTQYCKHSPRVRNQVVHSIDDVESKTAKKIIIFVDEIIGKINEISIT